MLGPTKSLTTILVASSHQHCSHFLDRHSCRPTSFRVKMSNNPESIQNDEQHYTEDVSHSKSIIQNSNISYKRPEFSDAFQKHVKHVTSTFLMNHGNEEGVECTGEPSMDPSRMVMDNGLDSEFLNDF